ncbi:hypothetical protein P4283_28045 [Bacillus thuringiensis]|nr:hypothetical protein [Bacillus thuringiensis]
MNKESGVTRSRHRRTYDEVLCGRQSVCSSALRHISHEEDVPNLLYVS